MSSHDVAPFFERFYSIWWPGARLDGAGAFFAKTYTAKGLLAAELYTNLVYQNWRYRTLQCGESRGAGGTGLGDLYSLLGRTEAKRHGQRIAGLLAG
ncbi:MAG: hypothetical protein D6690_05260 [Nitrospirae bacterium]|nr:MAG: hypothetical protein D6690_05260 [Nitrospirota bacterium]